MFLPQQRLDQQGDLFNHHERELSDYLSRLDHPLDILENEREVIRNGILSLGEERQLRLLDDSATVLEAVLGSLVDLRRKQRPLYKVFEQEVKGKNRVFSVPQKPLEVFLKHYVLALIDQAICHDKSHGAEKSWSPRSSLETHLPIGTALSFDISNAWGNIHRQYVFDFYYDLINPKLKDREVSKTLAGFLATVSTVFLRDQGYVLPQGSLIGSRLFNRILYPIDERLDEVCNEQGLRYTRWVDDFTVTSRHTDFPEEELLVPLEIVKGYFTISGAKTYLQRGEPIYLLGHRITRDNIVKASKEELRDRTHSK